jgi:hypothetical protein
VIGEHTLVLTDADVRLLLELVRGSADGRAEPAATLIRRIEGLLDQPQPADSAESAAAVPEAALLWHRPMLGLVTSQGSWVPEVELVNQTDRAIEQSGPVMAIGRLYRPDGTPVTSRQTQWPTPAALMNHRLAPGQSVSIRIAVMLLEDEIAALEQGFYRLGDVRWGSLIAPDKDVRVD